MASPALCTSIARRRLPEASALARAVAKHYPGEQLVVLVVDDEDDGAASASSSTFSAPGAPAASFRRLSPFGLGLDARVVHELALCREGDDLAACLLPALVHLLLGQGRPVVALSSEVVLLGRLDELVEECVESRAVLVPRLLGPVPVDGRDPTGPAIVDAGAFDPGIVAIGPGAGSGELLGWWAASLEVAASSPVDALATSQRFLDLAPQSFGARVLRHPGYGVACWNAHERALEWSEELGYTACGTPVRLVHLEGFDPATPQLIAPKVGRDPRVLLSEIPALRRLCSSRAAEVGGEDVITDVQLAPERVELADGTLLDARMRRLARRAIAAGSAAPPDPFDPAEVEAFHDWLASPDPTDVLAPTLPRYIGEIYRERRDLQWHFPRLATVDMAHFREWVASHGLDEAGVPVPVRVALARTPWWAAPTGVVVAPPDTLRSGVVLAGYLRAESGVGEAARLVYDAMISARVDVAPVVLGLTPSRQQHPFGAGRSAPALPVADRNVNLIWTNADQLPGFASVVGPEFFAGRYNIGYWAWETDRLPVRLAAHAALLDEIWVPSAYVRDAVEPVVDRPVQVFPHPIVAPAVDPHFDVNELGIPRGFRFLFTYDFLSSFERKNPLGVLEAFVSAFAPGEGPVLVLKSVNGDKCPADRERLLLAAAERADVVVVDRYLAADERGALLAACDCFVSLHRAEGFGLGLGEAMALGKPVIATGYSGNLEFMDDRTALLVPAAPTTVGPGAAPYDADDHWAEPDLEIAATHMRRLVEDRRFALELGATGRDSVLSSHGIARAERFAARRLGEIEKMVRKGYVSGAADAVRRML